MSREQIISTVTRIADEQRTDKSDLHVLRYDTDTDGTLMIYFSGSVFDDILWASQFESMTRFVNKLEDERITVKSVDVDDDAEADEFCCVIRI